MIGYQLNPRRSYFLPQTIKELVFKCQRCGKWGVGQSDSESSPSVYVFRRNAKDTFGWDARESKAAINYRKRSEEQQTL